MRLAIVKSFFLIHNILKVTVIVHPPVGTGFHFDSTPSWSIIHHLNEKEHPHSLCELCCNSFVSTVGDEKFVYFKCLLLLPFVIMFLKLISWTGRNVWRTPSSIASWSGWWWKRLCKYSLSTTVFLKERTQSFRHPRHVHMRYLLQLFRYAIANSWNIGTYIFSVHKKRSGLFMSRCAFCGCRCRLGVV